MSTTAKPAVLAKQIAEVLRQRGTEQIIQTSFYPTDEGRKMGRQKDRWIFLPSLSQQGTKNRLFSYTQLELLIASDLGYPIYTFFMEGDALSTAYITEPTKLSQRQQTFITEFDNNGTPTAPSASATSTPIPRTAYNRPSSLKSRSS